MFVVLCRGDENEAELEVFGLFENEVLATAWAEDMDSWCPNDHEVVKVSSV